MATGFRTAIYAGIAATLLIAATKFAAALATGSSGMLAEGIHSAVDSADGLLLLFARHRAARPADEEHPLGHGKELYFWALIVAILFFALGAGMSFYEGIHHITHPVPVTSPGWNYAVLAASAVFTLGSFVVAFREFRRRLGSRTYWTAFRHSKDPTIFTLVLEDLADLAGLTLAFGGVFLARRLHQPMLDGIASLGVGLVMTGVAALLARESKSLLVGEGATPAERRAICEAAVADPDVVAVRRLVTMYFGPAVMLVAMDVEFRCALSTTSIATAVERMETAIRAVEPGATHIYVEARSLREAANSAPGPAGPATA